MEGTIYLTKDELCEALHDYLLKRGAIPFHGIVRNAYREQGPNAVAIIDFVINSQEEAQ